MDDLKWLNRFISGCWFGRHGNLVMVRDDEGIAEYECQRCDEHIPIPWADRRPRQVPKVQRRQTSRID